MSKTSENFMEGVRYQISSSSDEVIISRMELHKLLKKTFAKGYGCKRIDNIKFEIYPSPSCLFIGTVKINKKGPGGPGPEWG
jgi:hypothetical protein